MARLVLLPSVESLIHRAQQTQRGFKDIERAAQEVLAANLPETSLELARQLFASEVHQARMLAVFIWGPLAARSEEVLTFLREAVSQDSDWRVQEVLAKAFDRYCADTGYELALPVIEAWLNHPHPNARRAVTEGLRIWTSRPYFCDHPDIALRLLGQLKNDESEYVRKSVGNAIRDLSRKHPTLVKAEIQPWDVSNRQIAQVYKLASKFLT